MIIKKGLPKIIDKSTRLLILGSFPSEQSLEKRQYYANKGNDFWRLISLVINEEITKSDYPAKINELKSNGIGLWDVYKSCERDGSLDKNIRNPIKNNFLNLQKKAPKLALICLNGATAGIHQSYFESLGYKTVVLLSSSGANRRYSKRRISQWQSILKH
jgi:double-stranded uracil-DNA glycosylase